ncbi:protein NPAT [Protopterus annectens]|uniref:protein NPAT n=1 Tax=Protopterus annectens TaxID=7888 RepID=UPI001CFB7BED|nr:protein NPAT [Protopterus annectens]
MLLPSDVARLVLGYLQQEKLTATCQAFILESPNLKEYAEHCSVEEGVSACLLSLFGKNLVSILNEYVSMKAKETTLDIQTALASLWKKLDITLSQIRSLQTSASFSSNQRARTRNGIAEIRRQRSMAPQQSSSELLPSLQFRHPSPMPISITPYVAHSSLPQAIQSPVILGHLYTQECRPVVNVSTGSTLQVVVPESQERRPQSSLLSPGRRKGEPSKKRDAGLSIPHVSARNLQLSGISSLGEVINENFPQMVIANATEKILHNKTLQEKLADTINKVLVNDSSAAHLSNQAPETSSAQEQSFDEILGLQGEIHMSEEAIQDILEQTESDPAFQALFDLFDYNKKNKKKSSGSTSVHGQDIQIKSTADVVDQETIHNPLGEQQDTSIVMLDSSFCSTKKVSPVTVGDKNRDVEVNTTPSKSGSESVIGSIGKQVCSLLSSPSNSQECSQAEESSDPTSDCIMPNYNPSTEGKISLEKQSSDTCSEKTSKTCSLAEIETEGDVDDQCIDVQNAVTLQQGHAVQIVAEKNSSSLSKEQETSPLVEKTEIEVKSFQQDAPLPSSVDMSSEIDEPNDTSLQIVSDTETEIACNILKENRETCQSDEMISATVLSVEKAIVCNFDSGVQNETEPINAKMPLSMATEQNLCSVSHSEYSAQEELSVEIQPSSSTDPEMIISEEDPETLHFEESFVEVENSPPQSPSKGETSGGASVDSDCIIVEDCSDCCSSLNGGVPQSSTFPHPTTITVSAGSDSLSTRQVESESPSKLVSLRIITSDPENSSVGEIKTAVCSNNSYNIPTIVMSSPNKTSLGDALSHDANVKSSDVNTSEKTEDTASAVSHTALPGPTSRPAGVLSLQSEKSNILPSLGMGISPLEKNIIHVAPAGSTVFRESDGFFVLNCVTDSASLSGGLPKPSGVMLPSSAIASSASASQQLMATPPRKNTIVTASNPVAKTFSQGSTFILSSPVQPVLQGMVGMIPFSLMGQNTRISLPQVVQIQAAHPGKLPIPARYRRPAVLRRSGKTSKLSKTTVNISASVSGLRTSRPGNVEKREIVVNSTTVAVATTASALRLAQTHRRVLSFDESSASSQELRVLLPLRSTEGDKLVSTVSPVVETSPVNLKSKSSDESRVESLASLSKQIPDCETMDDKTVSDENFLEKETPVESLCSTSANKENEMILCKEQQKSQEKTKISQGVVRGARPRKAKSSLLQDGSSISQGECNLRVPNVVSLTKEELTAKINQSKSNRQSVNLTSPLTKQAAEMLQDLQCQSPTPKQAENIDLELPRTPGSGTVDKHTEDTSDSLRTPVCKRLSEEGGTPRRTVTRTTPVLPTCSPVSETGSESSINMAAHTLMILSRATVTESAGTTPLKDNTQQFKSTKTVGQKRKLEDSEGNERQKQPVTEDSQNSVSPIRKKKAKKQKKKKLLDSFPTGLDVDKFLSSLHYDE